jgi:hypothetical protein
VQGSCATTTAHGPGPFTCRAAVFTCLAHFPLRIRSKTSLNSDRASFFCWCGVFCVACGACGTCAVFLHVSSVFDQDIGRWDVSSVTNMQSSKCLPSLARPFPSCIDPRRDCIYKGRVSRRRPTAAVLSRAAPLVFTCLAHFHLRIRSKACLNSDRALFVCWCGVFCVACGACGTCAVFYDADFFDQDIGRWDVSAVTSMGNSTSSLLSHILFPLASTLGGIACARVVCHDDGRRPRSFHLPRLWSLLALLTYFPLRIRSKTFLNSDRASFFCWCGVFCVACGACGTCAVFKSAYAFDQDIGRWNVSTVTIMSESKCHPSPARSFPSCIDPRRDCVCKGHVPRRRPTAAVLSRAAPLVFTCLAHFPLRIRSKTFLTSERAAFFLLLWCVLCCLWRVRDLRSVRPCVFVQPRHWPLGRVCSVHHV